ncbi:MAG: hypothetical protein AB1346_02740, partial [Thermodesulfobacteriota bacterium]
MKRIVCLFVAVSFVLSMAGFAFAKSHEKGAAPAAAPAMKEAAPAAPAMKEAAPAPEKKEAAPA